MKAKTISQTNDFFTLTLRTYPEVGDATCWHLEEAYIDYAQFHVRFRFLCQSFKVIHTGLVAIELTLVMLNSW